METAKPIQAKQQYSYNVKQVLFLCKITERELNDFILESRLAWAEHHFRHLTEIDKVMHSALFWSWFRYQWLDLDDRYFLSELFTAVPAFRYARYRQMHQIIFDSTQEATRRMYYDFLDMQKSFLNETETKIC
jgi:ribonuclease D